MSGNKMVTVLAPNGRRQNVKVTPNTTILQILEEVCNKQGFKSEEYDLSHHSHVLDTTTILRFSGLPNNATLEMLDVAKIREEKDVILGMHLEDGTRLVGTFSPNDNLLFVLKKLCPLQSDVHLNPVIIYMRREVYGLEPLQSTTLRALGLTGGRAMLRLIHRTPEELKTQANVSSPLIAKPVPEEESPIKPPPKIQKTTNASNILSNEIKSLSPRNEPAEDLLNQGRPNLISIVPNDSGTRKNILSPRRTSSSDKNADQIECNIENKNVCKTTPAVLESIATESEPEEEIIFLGERNAVAYSLSSCSTVLAQYNDLPDDFFDLTVNDVRKLLTDLKRRRNEVDEAPLQTEALRNLEHSKKVLTQLRQYKRCVLRIQFPDRLVLQGTFGPKENIQTVMDFVRKFLANAEIPFYLFVTPPKHILKPTSILVEEGCVPSALLHFGSEGISSVELSNTPKHLRQSFLRSDILKKLSTPTAAILAATKSRGLIAARSKVDISCRNEEAGTSAEPTSPGITAVRPSTPSGSLSVPPPYSESKMPKWFKPSK